MRSMPRIALLVAVIGAILLSFAGFSREADAQARQLKQLTDALLLFEQYIKLDVLSDDWDEKHDDWVETVRGASNASEVGAQVAALETAMDWKSVENSWRKRRDGWISDLEGATSVRAVAKALLELEQATRWTAVDDGWKELRDNWVAGTHFALGPPAAGLARSNDPKLPLSIANPAGLVRLREKTRDPVPGTNARL